MKTIFITICRGSIARNILQTNVLKTLKKAGFKIVLLTPAYQDEYFLKEFKDNKLIVEPLIELKPSFLERIFNLIHQGLLYNDTIDFRWRYGLYLPKETTFFRYLLKKIIFKPLSYFHSLREVVRWLDIKFFPAKLHSELFKKYSPSLVFATSLSSEGDAAIIKEAKTYKIPTIAMAKSWDNLCKNSFRVKADKLVVWSEFMKEQAMEYQNYKNKDIYVSGIPQFDFYRDKKNIMSRKDFFQKIGADLNKKLILFGSEGKCAPADPEIMEILLSFISKKLLRAPCQVLIRPHLGYKDDIKRFTSFKGKANVILDNWFRPSLVFKDGWDYSQEQIIHFTNSLYHCDILINSASTLTLDGIAFDKPIINIAFDGFQKKPYIQSVARWYNTEYYKDVAKTKASWLVKNNEEFLEVINSYLINPSLKVKEREELCQRFCYKIDGKSAQRIAEFLLKQIKDTNYE